MSMNFYLRGYVFFFSNVGIPAHSGFLGNLGIFVVLLDIVVGRVVESGVEWSSEMCCQWVGVKVRKSDWNCSKEALRVPSFLDIIIEKTKVALMFGNMREREDFPRSFPQNQPIHGPPPRALGLDALHNLCKEIYPNQGNPLTVTAIVKYWWAAQKNPSRSIENDSINFTVPEPPTIFCL